MFFSHEIIGLMAGMLTTAAFLPQLMKVIGTKSAGDFSWGWVLMMTVGVFLWFVYGLILWDMPIIVANFLTFLSLLTIGAVKMRHK